MYLRTYTKTEINSLIERFQKRQLPKEEWTHEAHLIVAFYYISQYPFNKALDLARENITKHNESVGTINSDTDGYHESITRFWMTIVSNYLKEENVDNIETLYNSFIKGEEASSKFPLTFYSQELLFSVQARHNWVEPNLKKLILL